jgi:hypothetical protein
MKFKEYSAIAAHEAESRPSSCIARIVCCASADVMRGVSVAYSGFFKPEGARRLASSVMHWAWIMLA